jgi:hypothetical protein
MAIPRRKKTTEAAAAHAASQIIPEPDTGAPPREEERAEPQGAEERADLTRAGDAPAHDEGNPWGVIVEDVRRINVAETYERLRADLMLGDLAHAYGEVAIALDAADRNYHDAVLLARATKLEQERVDREVNERLEVLRTSARGELEKEKGGKRATLEEVRDRVQANWPDEFGRLSRRTEEMHAVRGTVDGLVDAWASRAQSLRKLADRVAPPGAR